MCTVNDSDAVDCDPEYILVDSSVFLCLANWNNIGGYLNYLNITLESLSRHNNVATCEDNALKWEIEYEGLIMMVYITVERYIKQHFTIT